MRTTLRELTDQLTPHGFQRTHRSWLVNAGRMLSLERTGSGDYTAALEVTSRPPSQGASPPPLSTCSVEIACSRRRSGAIS